jgi:hypothetical protein
VIPVNHRDVDKSPDNILLTKEVLTVVGKLIEDHKFTKNYGLKRLITDLWHQGVAKAKNPSQKQLQNHLSCFVTKFLSFVAIHLWSACPPRLCYLLLNVQLLAEFQQCFIWIAHLSATIMNFLCWCWVLLMLSGSFIHCQLV